MSDTKTTRLYIMYASVTPKPLAYPLAPSGLRSASSLLRIAVHGVDVNTKAGVPCYYSIDIWPRSVDSRMHSHITIDRLIRRR